MAIVPKSFYRRDDVVQVSKDLLGKILCSNIDGKLTTGIIVETEAYQGATDKACHAYLNRRTPRTETFFNKGGVAYVYLCYGIHHLFNVITNDENEADAVLIRAIEPVDGIDMMMKRRKLKQLKRNLTGGPGILSQAMGITTADDKTELNGNKIWLEDRGIVIRKNQVIASPRVGCESAGEAGFWPWRFRVKESKWTSPGESKLSTVSK